MAEGTGILPGLPAVAGKPVHVGFDGGLITSDAGILLLSAVEQRLKIAERLAACLEDPRDRDRVRHELAEMIRYRALLIAAGFVGRSAGAIVCRAERYRQCVTPPFGLRTVILGIFNFYALQEGTSPEAGDEHTMERVKGIEPSS